MKKSLIFICLTLFCSNMYCQQNTTKKNSDRFNYIKEIEKKKKETEKKKNEQATRRREQLRRNIGSNSTKTSTKVSTYSRSSVNKQATNARPSQTNNKEKKYICPECGGTGVYSLMPNDIMAPVVACSGCQGRKTVTAQEYRQIIQAMVEVNKQLQPSRPSGRTAQKGKCPSCGGSGRCPTCAGQGVRLYERTYTTGQDGIIKCSSCNQSGKCSTCNGTGRGI